MARVIHKAEIERIRDHTANVREVFFRWQNPEGLCFKAGQFATLHVPTEPKPVLRAYSFASDEKDQHRFHLIFKRVEGGRATNYVWGWKGDEVIDFTAPFGRVFFKEPPTPQIVFLNTGSGISQHYSYLVSKKEQYPNLRYRMYFGLRNESEIFYRDELNRLKEHLTDFQFEYVLSRPSESWAGKKGYVQHFMNETDFRNIETTFYLCGNSGMIKEVKQHLIEKEGFDRTRILAEAFH